MPTTLDVLSCVSLCTVYDVWRLVYDPQFLGLPFDAVQTRMSVFARQKESSTPGSVYVEPHLVFFTNVRDLVDRIECTEDGCTCSGRNEERYVPFGFSFQYKALQFGRYHAAPRIVQNV